MIVGIIQARTGSSRLPRKILLKAAGKTMLEHMIERISNSKRLDKLVVATTTNQNDDVIVDLCKKLNIDCFRGSEEDVLSRYANASEFFNATTVVRLCSDSPLLDGSILDDVIDAYFSGNYDYVGNLEPGPRTFPDGLSVEIFSSKLLKQTNVHAKKPSEREHVTFYIWKHPEKFKLHRVDLKKNLSKFRFNLDYEEDYIFLKKIFENFYPKNKHFSLEEIIDWLEQHPSLLKINSNITPNQGWNKAFEKDKQLGFN